MRTTEERNCLQENLIFLFLLALLDVTFRIFPIHIKPRQSGLTDSEIQQLCAKIVDQLAANHSIDLTFVSVDGDPGYQTVFDGQFERFIPSSLLVSDLGPVLHVMQEFQSWQIGNFFIF
jgi:hypothetical protein